MLKAVHARRTAARGQIVFDDIDNDTATRRKRGRHQSRGIKSVCKPGRTQADAQQVFPASEREASPSRCWTGSTNLTNNGASATSNCSIVEENDQRWKTASDDFVKLKSDPDKWRRGRTPTRSGRSQQTTATAGAVDDAR